MDIVQQRIEELEAMRGRLELTQKKNGCWDWFLTNEIEELKNARQARRTLNLRTLLKSLVVSIVAHDPQKRKGAGA
jgi:hypothetical protein